MNGNAPLIGRNVTFKLKAVCSSEVVGVALIAEAIEFMDWKRVGDRPVADFSWAHAEGASRDGAGKKSPASLNCSTAESSVGVGAEDHVAEELSPVEDDLEDVDALALEEKDGDLSPPGSGRKTKDDSLQVSFSQSGEVILKRRERDGRGGGGGPAASERRPGGDPRFEKVGHNPFSPPEEDSDEVESEEDFIPGNDMMNEIMARRPVESNGGGNPSAGKQSEVAGAEETAEKMLLSDLTAIAELMGDIRGAEEEQMGDVVGGAEEEHGEQQYAEQHSEQQEDDHQHQHGKQHNHFPPPNHFPEKNQMEQTTTSCAPRSSGDFRPGHPDLDRPEDLDGPADLPPLNNDTSEPVLQKNSLKRSMSTSCSSSEYSLEHGKYGIQGNKEEGKEVPSPCPFSDKVFQKGETHSQKRRCAEALALETIDEVLEMLGGDVPSDVVRSTASGASSEDHADAPMEDAASGASASSEDVVLGPLQDKNVRLHDGPPHDGIGPPPRHDDGPPHDGSLTPHDGFGMGVQYSSVPSAVENFSESSLHRPESLPGLVDLEEEILVQAPADVLKNPPTFLDLEMTDVRDMSDEDVILQATAGTPRTPTAAAGLCKTTSIGAVGAPPAYNYNNHSTKKSAGRNSRSEKRVRKSRSFSEKKTRKSDSTSASKVRAIGFEGTGDGAGRSASKVRATEQGFFGPNFPILGGSSPSARGLDLSANTSRLRDEDDHPRRLFAERSLDHPEQEFIRDVDMIDVLAPVAAPPRPSYLLEGGQNVLGQVVGGGPEDNDVDMEDDTSEGSSLPEDFAEKSAKTEDHGAPTMARALPEQRPARSAVLIPDLDGEPCDAAAPITPATACAHRLGQLAIGPQFGKRERGGLLAPVPEQVCVFGGPALGGKTDATNILRAEEKNSHRSASASPLGGPRSPARWGNSTTTGTRGTPGGAAVTNNSIPRATPCARATAGDPLSALRERDRDRFGFRQRPPPGRGSSVSDQPPPLVAPVPVRPSNQHQVRRN